MDQSRGMMRSRASSFRVVQRHIFLSIDTSAGRGKQLAVQFGFAAYTVSPGTIQFHGFETLGSVSLITDVSSPAALLGYIGEGSLVLEHAESKPGSPVEGWFDGSMVRIGTARP